MTTFVDDTTIEIAEASLDIYQGEEFFSDYYDVITWIERKNSRCAYFEMTTTPLRALVWCGSNDRLDWFRNLQAWPYRRKDIWTGKATCFHSGFWRSWNEVSGEVLSLPAIDVVGGHSLGGQLAWTTVQQRGLPVFRVETFGERAGFRGAGVEDANELVEFARCWQASGDPVPTLLALFYDHPVGLEVLSNGPDLAPDHPMSNYVTLLKARAASEMARIGRTG